MNKYFMRKWHNFVNEQKDSNKVAKIILFNGEKILLLLSEHPDFKGTLDLPGGHLHYREDPTEGLRREVKEETGLIVTDYRKLYEFGNISFYYGEMPKGEVTLSEEHSDYFFLTINEINKKGFKISNQFYNAISEAFNVMHKS
jgi:8-oxo-dGTP pyrophosphatase MutT (NUDIX family)